MLDLVAMPDLVACPMQEHLGLHQEQCGSLRSSMSALTK
jgi:hypothetical protein